MLAADLLPALKLYIDSPMLRAALGVPTGLRFLAQGEYNINYLLDRADGPPLVLRVNTGTQIGKPGAEQIRYEAAALRHIAGQAVGPALLYLDDSMASLPYGLLAMEYLPGAPLDYADPAQIAAAAGTIARLHAIPAAADAPFIRRRPLHDDLAEADSWLAAYLACARAPSEVRAMFARLLTRAAEEAARHAARFPLPFGLAHTDVQAHNFILCQQSDRAAPADSWQCSLVDWERPLVDDPTYDLAHFLLPTTTRWKAGYSLSAAERTHFLASYCAARPELDADELHERLALRWPFILLRAVSWCASAWVAYTGPGRAIDNRDTLARIDEYLQPGYLRELFSEWL